MMNAIPAGYDLEVFAQVLSDGGEELVDTFEIFPSTFDTANKIVTVNLPTQVFSNSRNSAGTYEAVIILAPTPDGNTSTLSSSLSATTANATGCAVAPIACPLQGGCQVTSPFQEVRILNGVTNTHTGVDYSAAEGTAIFAAHDGTVERAYNSKSYGNTIIIRHNDGAATLYAHLLTMLVSKGDPVTRGVTQIGTSDGDPNTTPFAAGLSTGPHLEMDPDFWTVV